MKADTHTHKIKYAFLERHKTVRSLRKQQVKKKSHTHKRRNKSMSPLPQSWKLLSLSLSTLLFSPCGKVGGSVFSLNWTAHPPCLFGEYTRIAVPTKAIGTGSISAKVSSKTGHEFYIWQLNIGHLNLYCCTFTVKIKPTCHTMGGNVHEFSSVNCQFGTISNHLGYGTLGMLVGDTLISLVEGSGLDLCGGHHSLARILT